jgi:hypothetical protein
MAKATPAAPRDGRRAVSGPQRAGVCLTQQLCGRCLVPAWRHAAAAPATPAASTAPVDDQLDAAEADG